MSIASQLSRSGQSKTALGLAEKLTSEKAKNWLLITVALGQASRGDIQEALQSAERISDKVSKFTALVAHDEQFEKGIAQFQGEQGDVSGAFSTIEKAISIIRKIDDRDLRDLLLLKIAIAQTQIGDFQRSLRTITDIRLDWLKKSALQEIASIRAKTGHWKDAAQLLSRIQDPRGKIYVLLEVVSKPHLP